MIERRFMTQNIELHESMKQIKQLLDTYDHNLSSIQWMAQNLVRELNMFELAERGRY